MAFRNARSVARIPLARRKTFWIQLGGATTEVSLSAGTTLLHATLNAAALALRPFTVVRSIGSFWVSSDQVAATEFPFGAIGTLIADDRAVAAGVASVARPYSELADSDWFMNLPFATKTRFVTAAGFDAPAYQQYMYDQRGQRKVTIGNDIAFVVENVNTSHGMVFIWTARLLCLAN